MTIEKINKIKNRKNLFKVVFSNDESIILSADTIVKFGLTESLKLTENEYKKIIQDDKSSRIIADALSLVAKRSYSAKSLFNKLIEKGYEAENAKKAVERLKELNYINDEKFAATYAKYLVNRGKGEFAIKAELEKHSIDKDLIKKTTNLLKNEQEPHKHIIQIIKNKFKKVDLKDKNEVRRVASFFLRRGFSSENVAKAFREYINIDLDE